MKSKERKTAEEKKEEDESSFLDDMMKEPEEPKITINELQERLRQKSIFTLGDVEYAILETNGEISVIQKPEKRNTIPEDFSITPDYEGIPYDLIVDGKIMHENLKQIGRDEN